MGPFEKQVESAFEGGIGVDMNHAQFLRHSRTRVVWNWIVKAYNSRGGLGPWMVKDIIEGNRKYNVEGVRGKIDHSDAEEALEVLEKQGVVNLQRIPAGMIETFMINDLDESMHESRVGDFTRMSPEERVNFLRIKYPGAELRTAYRFKEAAQRDLINTDLEFEKQKARDEIGIWQRVINVLR